MCRISSEGLKKGDFVSSHLPAQNFPVSNFKIPFTSTSTFMLQNLEKKGGKKIQLHTFQCKSLILLRKRERKHCFGGCLLEIKLREWKCGNNQGPEAGGVAPKLLLSVGVEPSGAMKCLLELPTWESWEQGHGADTVLWYVGVLMSLGQQVRGENTWIWPDGGPASQARRGSFSPRKGRRIAGSRNGLQQLHGYGSFPGKTLFPPLGRSTDGVNAQSHSLQVWSR